MAGKKPKPGLDKADSELWQRVTDDLTPLSKTARDQQPEQEPQPVNEPTSKKGQSQSRAAPMQKYPPGPVNPSPSQMETRRVRRLARGNLSFDARIDLHGMYQKEAHARLLLFLREARRRGYRNILVITGKGKPSDRSPEPGREAPGVIRRNIRHWLNEPEFAELVTALSPARPNHGGEGALYLQLRR